MKERPILFSAPMVRAILAGQKTQTRRIVTLTGWLAKHETRLDCAWPDPGLGDGGYLKVPHRHPDDPTDEVTSWPVERVRCPYGAPGDRLWVRETFQKHWRTDCYPGHEFNDGPGDPETGWAVHYVSDGGPIELGTEDGKPTTRCSPSIFMPRWASRLTLEVTGVRVERLDDITEDDARAEGVPCDLHPRGNPPGKDCGCYVSTPRFRELWETINGKRAPWASNPWVWVVSFKPTPDPERP